MFCSSKSFAHFEHSNSISYAQLVAKVSFREFAVSVLQKHESKQYDPKQCPLRTQACEGHSAHYLGKRELDVYCRDLPQGVVEEGHGVLAHKESDIKRE